MLCVSTVQCALETARRIVHLIRNRLNAEDPPQFELRPRISHPALAGWKPALQRTSHFERRTSNIELRTPCLRTPNSSPNDPRQHQRRQAQKRQESRYVRDGRDERAGGESGIEAEASEHKGG